MVFTFEKQEEAERFYRVLPKRLAKFGLELHMLKSQVIPAGIGCAQRAKILGRRIPTFNFLGFTCYWGKSRNGKFWRLKYMSRKDRLTAKLKGLRAYLWNNMSAKRTHIVITN